MSSMLERVRKGDTPRSRGGGRKPSVVRSVSQSAEFADTLSLPPDPALATATVLLMAIGLVAVYSAGAMKGASTSQFLAKQMVAAILGIGTMIICSRVSLKRLEEIAGIFGKITLVLLAIVLIPGIGVKIAGARRWLPTGLGFNVQPSELARLASVLLVAKYAAAHPEDIRSMKGLMKSLILPAIFCGLILMEPDFDTALTVLAIGCVILFVAGVPWIYILGGAACGIAAAWFLISTSAYRSERIASYGNPWSDPRGAGYQIIQCWIAMGSGGFLGKGLGSSIQKLGYLPEAHTDFIFAVIGEEGGFVVTSLIVSLFAVIAWRGYRIAAAQSIPFARYLAVGITAMVTMQALLNLMVVTGLAPTTGVPLPLVSYGGTSLVFMTCALGILWGLSRRMGPTA